MRAINVGKGTKIFANALKLPGKVLLMQNEGVGGFVSTKIRRGKSTGDRRRREE
jgi:hypothetical protein